MGTLLSCPDLAHLEKHFIQGMEDPMWTLGPVSPLQGG